MAKLDTEARIRELLDRPYRMVVRGDPTEGYLAEAPELPGCISAGETPIEAIEMLRDAMAGWFEEMLESGLEIPEPGSH
jgi:antitoxin HicB